MRVNPAPHKIVAHLRRALVLPVIGLLFSCQSAPAPILDDESLLLSFFRPGHYAGVQETRAGLHCRVFHPVNMAAGRHPLVIWGNGTHASPASYRDLLEHWASHGFVVAAAMAPNAGRGVEMRNCMSMLLDENLRDGSVFQHKIDPARIGVAGHSQGGGGALMLGRDLRVTTTMAIQPYILGLGHNPSASENQNGPLLLLSGAEDMTASPESNQQPVFDQADVPVTWLTLRGATHMAPMSTGGSFRGPMTAWLRWMLLDDSQAARLFEGENCVLCTDERWMVRRKNSD
jgi:predicted dienelactone hydrolase